MKHEEVIENGSVERYLLGEMTGDQRAAFEEHYFDCRVCAADVTDGTRLMVAGRAVAREEGRPSNVVPLRRDRFRWLPAAAAAALILGLLGTGVGYRMGRDRIVRDQRPDPATQLVRVVHIDTGVSRAATAEKVPAVRAGDELRFDVEPHDDAASYVAVVTCGGKIQSTYLISRERAADTIHLPPLGELPAGRCELVIEGVLRDGNRLSITRSAFQVVGER